MRTEPCTSLLHACVGCRHQSKSIQHSFSEREGEREGGLVSVVYREREGLLGVEREKLSMSLVYSVCVCVCVGFVKTGSG